MRFEQLAIGTDPSQASRPALSRLLEHGPVPRLTLEWQRGSRNFFGNLGAILRAPVKAEKVAGAPILREGMVSGRLPRVPLLASLVWHTGLVILLFPLGRYLAAQPPAEIPRSAELTWYGRADDLPAIFPIAPRKPRVRAAKTAPAPEAPPDSVPEKGSEAFHPRLTIINRPLQPNHPRQTLIQPDAPPEPPKILPALPNIVEWQEPGRPRPKIDTALRQANPRAVAQQEVAAPDLPDGARQPDALALASDSDVKRPALPVAALAAPRARSAQAADQAAPEASAFGSNDAGQRLIALSAAPAPVAPPSEPLGNLSSRLSISPEPSKSGAAGEIAGKGGESSGAGSGPAGLTITGGGSRPAIAAGGRGSAGSGAGLGGARPPVQPGVLAQPGVAAASSASPANAATRTPPPNSLAERVRAGAKPESLLDGRVYSLNVNMPNLTSAAGSWILSFAELGASEDPYNKYQHSAELTGPVPLHKVDPKYPPQLRSGHVEGEVLLYAVIRKDGSVDSIQLLSGVDRELDNNAMQALAQWKFRPGQRGGAPVDLEAIVHIPLRAAAPQY